MQSPLVAGLRHSIISQHLAMISLVITASPTSKLHGAKLSGVWNYREQSLQLTRNTANMYKRTLHLPLSKGVTRGGVGLLGHQLRTAGSQRSHLVGAIPEASGQWQHPMCQEGGGGLPQNLQQPDTGTEGGECG